jgi:3-hydroxybutyryl-CoA dehydrogenase
MGRGIAHSIARMGFPTIIIDKDERIVDAGIKKIFDFIDKGIEKGKTSKEEKIRVEKYLKKVTDIRDLSDCDLVIEAINEDFNLKKELFKQLEPIAQPKAIFASNTSSLKISLLAGLTKRKDKFVGLHFFNPAPLMPLCEIVRIEDTSDEVFTDIVEFIKSLGKTPIICKDTTGFVVNRLLTPYLLDAVRALEADIASIEDIDNAMKLGCGYPMGPLTLIDYVGVDVVKHIAEIMFREFALPQYAPPALLEGMIAKGWLGRKSGMGFYDYSKYPPEALTHLVVSTLCGRH